MGIFPKFRGGNKKYLSCHHLGWYVLSTGESVDLDKKVDIGDSNLKSSKTYPILIPQNKEGPGNTVKLLGGVDFIKN